MPLYPGARGRGGTGGSAARLRTPPDIFQGGNRRAAEAARDAGLNAGDLAEFNADSNLYIILRYGGSDRYQNRILNQWRTITNVARGATGAAGRDGTDGTDGATGPRGPAGPQGPRGDQGFPGRDGTDGTDGKDGATGPRGAQGEKGAQGDPGPAGPQGPQGPQGPRGPAGTGTSGSAAPAYAARLRIYPETFKTAGDIRGTHTAVLDELQQSLLFDDVSPAISRFELIEVETSTVVHTTAWMYSGAEQEIRFEVSAAEESAIANTGSGEYFTFRGRFFNRDGFVTETNNFVCAIGTQPEFPANRGEVPEQRVLEGHLAADLTTIGKFNFLNDEAYITRRIGEGSIAPGGDFEDFQAANYGGAFATDDLPDPTLLQLRQWVWNSDRLQAEQVFSNTFTGVNEFRDVDVNRLITSGNYRGHWPTDAMALEHIQANGDFYSNDVSGALRVVRNYTPGSRDTSRLELDKIITAHEPVYSTAALSWDIHPANLASWTADALKAIEFQITIAEPAPVIYNMYYEVHVDGYTVVSRRAWVNATTLPVGKLSSADAGNVVANLNGADHLDVEIVFFVNQTTSARSASVHRRINLQAASGGGGGGETTMRENIYTGTLFQIPNGRLDPLDVDEDIDPNARYQVALRYPSASAGSNRSTLLSGTFQGDDLIDRVGAGGTFTGDFPSNNEALAIPVAKAGSSERNHNLFLQYGSVSAQRAAATGKTRLYISHGDDSSSTFMMSFYKLGSGGGGSGGVNLASGRGLELDDNGRLGLNDAALEGQINVRIHPFEWVRGSDTAKTFFLEIPVQKASDTRLRDATTVIINIGGFTTGGAYTPQTDRHSLVMINLSASRVETISDNLQSSDTTVQMTIQFFDRINRVLHTSRLNVPVVRAPSIPKAPNVLQAPVAGGDSSGTRTITLPANYQSWKWLTMTMWDTGADLIGTSTYRTSLIHLQSNNQQFSISGDTVNVPNSSNSVQWASNIRTMTGNDGARFLYAELHD